jgi:hypothetical protein
MKVSLTKRQKQKWGVQISRNSSTINIIFIDAMQDILLSYYKHSVTRSLRIK